MIKKTQMIVFALVLVLSMGATVAFAETTDEEKTAPQATHEDRLTTLVDKGVITQEQADSILAGVATIADFVDREDLAGSGFRGNKNAGKRMNLRNDIVK